jgi:hypothetical protein
VGLFINEYCEVSPWLADKLVRRSAHLRYEDPARAEERAEELAAYIKDRPGKIFKLLSALNFLSVALVCRARRSEPVRNFWDKPVPYAEHLVHRTVRGEIVRSKSELVIANYLHSIGLQYEYERDLKGTADPGHLRPDFSFIDDTGNIVLWEHLGMLDRSEYAGHWEWKRAWYARNGFELNKNLFATSEIGGLDMRAVETMAKKVQNALS